MSDSHATADEDSPPSPVVWVVAEIALIAILFQLQANWRLPAVNEPHYLAKANHYWNNAWCQGDFFLDSRNAHRVFYWSFGWLTQFLPLEQVAFVGRWLTWGLLAWAWRGLSWSLLPKLGFGVLSAALWVTLLANCHLSGEWVIGGVEAKGFAYVLVLLGLRALVEGRWKMVWPLLGAAAAFHVLVGGWSIVAAGVAWCFSRRDAPGIVAMLPWLALGFVLSLAGLAPALLLNRSVDPEIVQQANVIYVFNRLPHHLAIHTLDPDEIIPRARVNAGLLIAFVLLWQHVPWSPASRRLRGYFVGSMLIAIIGLVLAIVLADQPATAAGLLRYYWFRLYDFALPMAAALLVCVTIDYLLHKNRQLGHALLTCAVLASAWHFVPTIATHAKNQYAPANRHTQPEADWIEACYWVRDNTPADALFMTPRMSSTFKWYAERPEVVTQKDIPQDAEGIVQWWDRMDRVHRFRHKPPDGDYERRYRKTLAHQGERMLGNLARKYGAEFMITRTKRELSFEKIFANESYVVYALPPANDASRKQE